MASLILGGRVGIILIFEGEDCLEAVIKSLEEENEQNPDLSKILATNFDHSLFLLTFVLFRRMMGRHWETPTNPKIDSRQIFLNIDRE